MSGLVLLSHSGHWGINPPLSFQAPPLNQQTVQAPPFLGNPPPIFWFFVTPLPLKVGSFSEPQKY